MKNRDRINLINRAIAALETPEDLSREDIAHLIEDLDTLAEEYRKDQEHANQS
jgi:hypothetical protein